ncbi:hypothetical protein BKA81DRAFT_215422 [Phyllosticta paracitricarpa]|uniref:Uncharacterized protein n=1 Tax=Phyllosticta citricarpa TaxID=55181 RepID=A0ABR1L602_9PEZI
MLEYRLISKAEGRWTVSSLRTLSGPGASPNAIALSHGIARWKQRGCRRMSARVLIRLRLGGCLPDASTCELGTPYARGCLLLLLPLHPVACSSRWPSGRSTGAEAYSNYAPFRPRHCSPSMLARPTFFVMIERRFAITKSCGRQRYSITSFTPSLCLFFF